MLMGCRLRQLKLPIKLIVLNNSALAFVELEMKAAGIVDFGTDLHNPNLAKLAESAGLLGIRVEAIVSRQELSMPPTITLEQMKGFTLFTLKVVLSGRGDEIVDLAKTNLFR